MNGVMYWKLIGGNLKQDNSKHTDKINQDWFLKKDCEGACIPYPIPDQF